MKSKQTFLISFICVISYTSFVIAQKTRSELRKRFEAPDFVFDLGNSVPNQGNGGTIRPLTLKELPSLEV
jgi:hypothetical protein